MQPTVRFATVGTGWIVDTFILGARQVEGLVHAAVYSRTRARGEEYARKFGVEQVYTDLESLAAAPDIDAVYIASPNALHAPQSRLFLEHGKHVICEKPVTADPRLTRELQQLAAAHGVVYMEAIMMLHQPQLQPLRDAVARLGRVSLAHFDFTYMSAEYGQVLRGENPNMFNPAMQTGCMMDLGIYCIYPAVVLFGMPERILTTATFLPPGTDDTGAALFAYPDKQLVLTWGKAGGSRAVSQIIGDGGTLTIDFIAHIDGLKLFVGDAAPEEIWGRAAKNDLMGNEAAAFYRYITAPDETAAVYRQNSHYAVQVGACMREIRRLAGIAFPDDRPWSADDYAAAKEAQF